MSAPDLAPDEIAVLRAALPVLDALARRASDAARRATSAPVCGRENNRASGLFRAARVIEHELHDGREGA